MSTKMHMVSVSNDHGYFETTIGNLIDIETEFSRLSLSTLRQRMSEISDMNYEDVNTRTELLIMIADCYPRFAEQSEGWKP